VTDQPFADLAARLDAIRQRIERAGGDPAGVEVLAVTKGFGPDAVAAARAAGLGAVGENYARELEAKRAALAGDAGLRWHFLGAIQTNKIRSLAPIVDCWQSVSRAVEGERLARARPGAMVLVQVAFSTAAGRPGCEPDRVPALVATLQGLGLDVAGLMAVAPRPPEEARIAFRLVRGLADDLGLAVRSLGMTEDLEAAVAEGCSATGHGARRAGDGAAER
jgi:uncharacterized pyridoxal phosphate-containing UPF0001 family protein